jgi:hypothetical protein
METMRPSPRSYRKIHQIADSGGGDAWFGEVVGEAQQATSRQ